MTRQHFIFLLAMTFGLMFHSCHRASVQENAKTEDDLVDSSPHILLISLDGFRWDYVKRFQPPHLSKFIAAGVQAESLIPSYPSKTFPNHYTIATGMYPDNHGLLGNTFYDYEKEYTYSMRDRETVRDGDYYGGTPIWIQAHRAGLITASYFFVGSDVKIQGITPTYYYDFDGRIPNDDRIDQVVKWLSLPDEKRPQMTTLYFSDMDNTGHQFGPNNDDQLKERLKTLDSQLGRLFDEIAALNLNLNIIIVSDHGMAEIHVDRYIPIEKIENDDMYMTIDNGSIASIHPKDEANTDSIYNYLTSIAEHFKVYKTEESPHFESVPKNKNWGAIQIIPDFGHYFQSVRQIAFRKNEERTIFGQHGFATEEKDMHGIFYANGPAFKSGYTANSVKNIHIYPLMCKILGISPPDDIDGKLSEVEDVLK